MVTLHIEHPITGFAEWKAAFDRLSAVRTQAGVRRHTVRRPVDDSHYIVVDLDFDTTDQASSFLGLLRSRVWSSAASSPALDGAPRTQLLDTVEVGDDTVASR